MFAGGKDWLTESVRAQFPAQKPSKDGMYAAGSLPALCAQVLGLCFAFLAPVA
jgi:hypothetical protein